MLRIDLITKTAVLMVVLLYLFEVAAAGKKPLIWTSTAYHQFEKILRSTDTPVGFSETFVTLRKIRFEIKRAGKSSRLDKLYFQKSSVQKLLDVFEQVLSHCPTVFSEIEKLSQEFRECSANLVPYLEECKKQQEEFCQLLDQDGYLNSNSKFNDAMGSLFGQVEADFNVNQQALATIQTQLSEAEQHFQGRLLDKFRALRDEISELTILQDTSRYGCNFVFADISRLSDKYQDKPNVLKYLRDCEMLQKDFCAGNK